MRCVLELKQYWNLILKNLTAVLILSTIGASLGLVFSLASPKMYESESQIFISTPTPVVDITALQQGSSFAQQRVISYAKVITGPATLAPVIQQLGLNMSTGELAKKIKSTAPLGSVLINITVTDFSPERSAAIANAVAIQFGETVRNLELPQFGDSAGVKSTMVQSGEIPTAPSSPNTKLNILSGLLFGFVLACIVGIIRQVFDNSVKNSNHLNGHSLLSTIFYDPEAAENPLLSGVGNYTIRAESFRHLRTSLKLNKDNSRSNVIAVTSAFPGEGKTTTSINLAIAFAQTGLKVGLVEADLRRPTFTKYFHEDLEKLTGLTEVLGLIENGKAPRSFQKFFRVFGNSEECIEWISSGTIPSNPAELMDSQAMSTFVDKIRLEYDLIIIDTPPALPVTDAAVISTKVDSVLVVARAGVTKQSHLSGVFEILENLNSQIMGVVLNMVPQNARGEEYGYSYNRYQPKSKYGYNYGYGYGMSKPYGPLVLQGDQPVTGATRVPFDVRLKTKLASRKQAGKLRNMKSVETEKAQVTPEQHSLIDFEAFLEEIKKGSN